jgi:type I restriction enzyme, S subunit
MPDRSHWPKYLHVRSTRSEWAKAIPSHWTMVPLKHLVHVCSGNTPSKERLDFWGGDIPWASSKDLKVDVLPDTEDHLTPKALTEGGAVVVPEGSVLSVVRGMILAHTFPVCVAGRSMAINQDLKAFLPKKELQKDYLPWLLRGAAPAVLALTEEAGHGTKALRMEKLMRLELPVPPNNEQEAITRFLSVELPRIDLLVAKQERLVDLLTEKQESDIRRAVTKGVKEDAPTRFSGVEWLGDVPQHWDMCRLRYLCDIQTGGKDTVDAEEDGQYPFYVRSQTVERINTYSADCEAVLTAGDGVGVGKVFHYANGKFDFHQRVYMMNRFRRVSAQFFHLYLASLFHKVAMVGGAKSTVDSLRMPVFKNFWVTVPPISEQNAIVSFVRHEAAMVNNLIAKCQHAIELLHEHRASLISAVVTGKIRVGEDAPSRLAAEEAESAIHRAVEV